ncbi:MAG: exodeoxyribonuclease V subunit beta [Desulfobacterales bacterium]|nr:exodeoxyribonuclease V subunit beta [Desulfobacterales bacterium]
MTRQLDPLTVPLHGTCLIEASAGTGKTYTIAALYLRLVLGHGGENSFSRALVPPEILVVTFTNAATEELRDRIRLRLREGAAFFREQADGDPYLIALRNEFTADLWPAKARMLDQAAQWMDEAAIHTIHAWCQRMLGQHAFESGSLFEVELETSDQQLLETAACDYWRIHFYPRPATELAELLALVKCRTPQDLLVRVGPLLKGGFPQPPEDPFEMLARRRQAVEEARQRWALDFSAAVEGIRNAQADKTLKNNMYRADALENWLDQLTAWVRDSEPLPEDKIRDKLSTQGLAAGTAKGKTTPEHPAYQAFDRLREQMAAADIETALLAHGAEDIARRLELEKRRRSRIGFDDLLTRLNDALHEPGNSRLARVIREQFPVAMIDEFQDTDPVQYATFSRIYLHQPQTALFVIGDPKQAIYAFRGADIHTYLRARRDAADNHYTLGKNFRSTRELVAAVNRMFVWASGHPDGAFLFGDRIPYETVAAQGRKDCLVVDGEPVSAMTFWHLQQNEPVPKTGDKGYLARMAGAAAGEIVRLLNLARTNPPRAGFQAPDGPVTAVRPSDMAVLVRDRNEARALRRALDLRQVPSVYLSDKDSIFDGREAVSLFYLLCACAAPERERRLKTALATEIIDLPLEQIDGLNRDESAWEAQIERFREYRRIWQCQGVLPMLRRLLGEFNVAARLLSMAGGERTLTNFLHLAELLQAAASRLDGEQALIRWLAEQIAQPGSGDDEQILRLESDAQRVRVVTVHKSKGLEYPLVFLPFVCSFRQITRANTMVVKTHDDQGRSRLVLAPADRDFEAADRERLAEDLRLLYVAATRARYACWMGIGVMGKTVKAGEKSKLHLSGLGYLLKGGDEIPTGEVLSSLEALKGDCDHMDIAPLPDAAHEIWHSPAGDKKLAPARVFTSAVPQHWWIASYSGISAGAGQPEADDPAADIPLPDSATQDQFQEGQTERPVGPEARTGAPSIHRFPRGPDPGTFLHAILEWAAAEGFDQLAGDRQRVAEQMAVFCKPHDWNDWVDVLTDWLIRLIQTPFLPAGGSNQDQGSLAALGAGDYQSEMEFLFAAHGVNSRTLDQSITDAVMPGALRPRLRPITVNGMLKGFIDLVFCFQGRYYVLDYKSNYLGENELAYGENALDQAMCEHRYDLQYVLYTLALHRLLKARLNDYDYGRDVGGVVYLFLRGVTGAGQGVYADKPPQALIERLDDDFAGKETGHGS